MSWVSEARGNSITFARKAVQTGGTAEAISGSGEVRLSESVEAGGLDLVQGSSYGVARFELFPCSYNVRFKRRTPRIFNL